MRGSVGYLGLAICLALLGGLYAGSAERTSPSDTTAEAQETADAQDLLVLGPLQPIRLRLRIEVEGVPFRTAWRTAFDRLFDQLDSDHDDHLTPQQASQLRALFASSPAGAPLVAAAAQSGAMMTDKMQSREDLLASLLNVAPPFSIRQRLSSRGAGAALTPLLDTDGDGRLSADELRNAEQSLHCRDFNDDQMLTEQELLAAPSLSLANSDGDSSVAEGPVIALGPAVSNVQVAEILLARYDRNRDGALACLAPAEIRLTADQVAALDEDRDQMLSRQELRRFAELPFVAEMPLGLGSGPASRKQPVTSPDFKLRRKLDGGFRLNIGSNDIDFRRNNRDPGRDSNLPSFSNLDADKSGYLEEGELANFPMRPELSVIDTDNDGKVSSREFDAYFQLRAQAISVQLVLEVSDQGYDLFTTLDRNFDRVLTPRELHAAPQAIAAEDRDGDGYLSAMEMSYSLLVELSRGSPRAANNVVMAQRGPVEPQVKAELAGPVWFRKLDRNQDGDVSLQEFIGPSAAFRKFDTDGDGLISAAEAAATEK